jgi:probable F420-dependent oxidoreductase
MKFALNLAPARPDRAHELAIQAEAIGYDAVFVPDHLFIPVDLQDRYPGTADGALPWPRDIPLYDPFVLLTRIAEMTTTIKLGTGIYLLPLRHPIITARAVTALDVFSKGRVLLGVGVGWLTEEFRALGMDPKTRFGRAEEAAQALRALWTTKEVEHHGKYYDFGPLYFEPKPVSAPHPPILFGGESEAAMRRAVRFGDGWISGGGADDAAAVRRSLARIAELRDEFEVDRPFDITMLHFDPSDEMLEALAEGGANRILVAPWKTGREAPASIEAFAERFQRVVG